MSNGGNTFGDLIFGTRSGFADIQATERMRISSAGTIKLNAYTTNGIVHTTGGTGTLTTSVLDLAADVGATILPIANGGTNSSTKVWWDLSGNAPGAASILGTTDNSPVTLQTGTGALTVTAGSISTTTGGNYTLDGITTSVYNIGASTTTGTIAIGGTAQSGSLTIGGTAQTGTITLGSSTGANSVIVGGGAGVTGVGIGNGVSGNTITIANGTNTAAQTVSIANGASAGNSTVSILSGAGTAGTGTLSLGNNTRVTSIDIGNVAPAVARTITIAGGNSAVADVVNIGTGLVAGLGSKTINIATGASTAGINTVNIGTGNTSVAGGNTIHIGDGTPTGTNLITIGSNANVASTTTIKGGNGVGAITLTPQTTGTIIIGAAAGIGSITLGSSTGAGQTVNIGSGNTTGTDVINIGTGTAATSKTINVATQAASTINVATGAFASTLTIGNTTGATALNQLVGTGNYSLDGVAASNYTIGASTTTGNITIGGTAQSGTITLGSSTAVNTMNIGTGTGNTTVNIATSGGNTVNVGGAGTTAGNGVRVGNARFSTNKPTAAVTNGNSNFTATVTQVFEAGVFVLTPTSNGKTFTFPTAQGAGGLVQNMPGVTQVGDIYQFVIINNGFNTLTMVAGAGGTMAGNTSIAASESRVIWMRVTSVTANSETISFY
jgi:hypothetical protein